MFIFKKAGFTIVELIIVLALLGILSTTGFSLYAGSMKNARDARRKADLETIRQALELYKSEKSAYPDLGGGQQNVQFLIKLGDGTAGPLATYINANNFPDDPNSKIDMMYVYERVSSLRYNICAYLETGPTAPGSCGFTNTCKSSFAYVNCNYGISQP